jgi:hypothetical protein
MTEVRSYTNGHVGRPGTAAQHDQRHGDFVNALQDAVRENPISAALVGMGVLWMFMGGSNTSLFGGSGRKSIFRTAMQGAEQVGDAVRDAAETVTRTANVAAGTASQVTDAVWQASAVVGDTASRTAGQAVDAVSSAYGATTDVASRAAESAATALQNTGAKWGTNLSDLFDRQPLLLGAVGLAIGAGIASSILRPRQMGQALGGREGGNSGAAQSSAFLGGRHVGRQMARMPDLGGNTPRSGLRESPGAGAHPRSADSRLTHT